MAEPRTQSRRATRASASRRAVASATLCRRRRAVEIGGRAERVGDTRGSRLRKGCAGTRKDENHLGILLSTILHRALLCFRRASLVLSILARSTREFLARTLRRSFASVSVQRADRKGAIGTRRNYLPSVEKPQVASSYLLIGWQYPPYRERLLIAHNYDFIERKFATLRSVRTMRSYRDRRPFHFPDRVEITHVPCICVYAAQHSLPFIAFAVPLETRALLNRFLIPPIAYPLRSGLFRGAQQPSRICISLPAASHGFSDIQNSPMKR